MGMSKGSPLAEAQEIRYIYLQFIKMLSIVFPSELMQPLGICITNIY